MGTIVMIPRKMRVGADETKVQPATFNQLGWTLRDKNWEKMVDMPLFGEVNKNTPGGVPTLGEVTHDNVLNYVDEVMSGKHITPKELMKAILNGVYLFINSANKPSESTSYDVKLGTFTAQNCKVVDGKPQLNDTYMTYVGLIATPVQAREFVERWFETYKPAVTA